MDQRLKSFSGTQLSSLAFSHPKQLNKRIKKVEVEIGAKTVRNLSRRLDFSKKKLFQKKHLHPLTSADTAQTHGPPRCV